VKTDEIRKRFLDFFRRQGHIVLPSDSLVPAKDPTLLFTGAGMNQFKEEFLGRGRRELKRVATSQKCLRTADIEKVGRTASHHTFFEMLGNFSFGDYFKEEALLWAWEFLLEEMMISADKLYASVYKDDEETYEVWRKKIGLDAGRIYRFGEDENFWPANAPSEGPNGPCGPCSEIFYDLGPASGCGRPDCKPGCSCDRFVEIWNLVFTQFDRREDGTLAPLPQKNIDTGMGLERMAAVMQGVSSNFDTDIFKPIVRRISEILDLPYGRGAEITSRIRRIADHTRAVVFCVADGVLPSNEGRGYVERRLIRRALTDAWFLGRDVSFIYRLVPIVAEVMKEAYPELMSRREEIAAIVRGEEERFRQTLHQGLNLLESMIKKMKKEKRRELSGQEAFRLHDTYGFPLELTEAVLEREGLSVNRLEYDHQMERQREMARGATRISGAIFAFASGGFPRELEARIPPTRFIGYEKLDARGKVLAIISPSGIIERADAGTTEEVDIIVDVTPFYAEAGGQVGDTGVIEWGEFRMQVRNTIPLDGRILHRGSISTGEVKVGEKVYLKVDEERRLKIAANHTATHLLHWALREVLGQHALQSGSLVSAERLRFDFTHHQGLRSEEIERVEELVNKAILEDRPVRTHLTTIDKAKDEGAIALFGEKYGKEVRVVEVSGISKELCGGTHLQSTGKVGFFRIVGEESVAAGIRRITAVTREAAYEYSRSEARLLGQVSSLLSVPVSDVPKRVEALIGEIKKLRKDLQTKKARSASDLTGTLLARAKAAGETRVIAALLKELEPAEMRILVDRLKRACKSAAILLSSVKDDKVQLVAGFTEDLVRRGLDANRFIKEVARIVGGGGGGRANLAQAGGKDIARAQEAVNEAERLLLKRLGP